MAKQHICEHEDHDEFRYAVFRKLLLQWYDAHGRQLPWRATRDPYRILVSEIMLQQTQAAAVIDYFARFLARFPTLESLATAELSDVLQMWQGLGYYRRARSLHAAAIEVMDKHHGKFPTKFEFVLALPGVGRYTAGAITSFAYQQKQGIVEANTQRLYARLLKLQTPLTSATTQKALWRFAEKIVRSPVPDKINHAVMDLGSMICKPQKPACLMCPINSLCPTFAAGLQSSIPVAKPRKKFVELNEIALAVLDPNRRMLLWQRPDDGWWAGLWDLPRQRVETSDSRAMLQLKKTLASLNLSPLRATDTQRNFAYGVTHHKISARLYRSRLKQSPELPSLRIKPPASDNNESGKSVKANQNNPNPSHAWQWVDTDQLAKIPLSSSARAMVKWLENDGILLPN